MGFRKAAGEMAGGKKIDGVAKNNCSGLQMLLASKLSRATEEKSCVSLRAACWKTMLCALRQGTMRWFLGGLMKERCNSCAESTLWPGTSS